MYNGFTVGGWIKYVASRATDGLTNGDMFTSYQLCKGEEHGIEQFVGCVVCVHIHP